MAKGGKKAADSKKVSKGTKCFMKFNSNGSAYRVCKSAKEIEFEKKRAAKNKKKTKILAEKRKQLKKLEDDILKAKRDLKKVDKQLRDKKSKK